MKGILCHLRGWKIKLLGGFPGRFPMNLLAVERRLSATPLHRLGITIRIASAGTGQLGDCVPN
jgi:hypothetical protein